MIFILETTCDNMENWIKDWWEKEKKHIKQQRVCVWVQMCISGGRGMNHDTEMEIIEDSVLNSISKIIGSV